MKTIFLFSKLFIVFFIVLISSSKIAFGADLYKIDPAHTNLTWHANHFGFSNPSGKFTKIDGKIIIDKNNPQNSSVDVLVYTNSINTGFPKFDEHLKSADFLDVQKFPIATFKSSSVINFGTSGAKVSGILTIKEITKSVTFDVKINKNGVNPLTQKKTIGMTISGKINRSDFGINYGIPGIGDEVIISIESEAIYESIIDKQNPPNNNSEWQIISDKSKIEFEALQKGSVIKGAFKKFSGKINFDPNLLNQSSVIIEVDTTSLDMSFAEALETAKSTNWLAILKYPKAIFKSEKFTALSGKNNYSAKGTLELKGRSVPITLNFNFKAIDKKFAYAIGSVLLKRTDFNIGERSVANANGVEENVMVNFEIQADKKFQ